MVRPVAGIVEQLDPGVAEMGGAAVEGRVRCPALQAVAEQHRAGDRCPEAMLGLGSDIKRGQVADRGIMLDGHAAVLVMVRSMAGEMLGKFEGQPRVDLHHPRGQRRKVREAARCILRECSASLDQPAQHLDLVAPRRFGLEVRGEAQPFDIDHARHPIGIEAAIAGDDIAAERMADHRTGWQIERVDQCREILDEIGEVIGAVARPVAVTMAAQIGGNDAIITGEGLGDLVPAPRMIATAMLEDQRRRGGIAPFDDVEPEPGGGDAVGAGFGHQFSLREKSPGRATPSSSFLRRQESMSVASTDGSSCGERHGPLPSQG